MEKKRSGFDTALKVLEYLKARKCTTDSEMAARLDIPMSSVTAAVNILKENGYMIDSMAGCTGGREYKGKRNVTKKLKKKEKKWIIEKYSRGERIKNLTSVTRVSRHSIYYTLKVNGVKTKSQIIAEKKPLIKELYNKGFSLKKIAEISGLEEKYLKSNLYKLVRGNRKNKVDREEVKEYILANPDKTGKEIAKILNISEATVCIVKKSIL